MTTPKPNIPAVVTPASPTTLTQEANRDFYKDPDFSATTATTTPKDGLVPSPTAETAKLGINPEPKVDVAAAPVVATKTNGQAQETLLTPKADAATTAAPAPTPAVAAPTSPTSPTSPTTITPATTTVATSAVPGITAAIAAAVNSTDDVDMTLAPGTPIEELNFSIEESIEEDSDQDQGMYSRHLKLATLCIPHETTEYESAERKRENGKEEVTGCIATKTQDRRAKYNTGRTVD